MIVPDLNMLIYAHNRRAPEHVAAQIWWRELLRGEEAVGLAWVVINGFIRLMSQRGVLASPLSPTDASAYVENWLNQSHIAPINPGDGHLTYFRRYLAVPGAGPNLVTDAHIAALATEHNAEVHTNNDADFARFSGLRWRNPLK